MRTYKSPTDFKFDFIDYIRRLGKTVLLLYIMPKLYELHD